MLFKRKRGSQDAISSNDPVVRREEEIARLEGEREALNADIEKLLREYSLAIGSREPIKGVRAASTQPNEYSFWHKRNK